MFIASYSSSEPLFGSKETWYDRCETTYLSLIIKKYTLPSVLVCTFNRSMGEEEAGGISEFEVTLVCIASLRLTLALSETLSLRREKFWRHEQACI